MNIQALPDEYKEIVTWRLDNGNPICQSISNYMNARSTFDRAWQRFVLTTQQLDKIRNQDITSVIPEIAKYVK